MSTATTRREWIPSAADTLYLAFDLGNRIWKLAFTIGAAQPPRRPFFTIQPNDFRSKEAPPAPTAR